MENELDIKRDKIVQYYTWSGYFTCVPFVPLCGIGLLFGVLNYVLSVTWLPLWAGALRYSLDDKALRVEQGRLFKSRKSIPLEKITDLELVQGPLLRYFDMWIINVQTASTGSQSPEATLIGLVNPEQVREEILAAKTVSLKSS